MDVYPARWEHSPAANRNEVLQSVPIRSFDQAYDVPLALPEYYFIVGINVGTFAVKTFLPAPQSYEVSAASFLPALKGVGEILCQAISRPPGSGARVLSLTTLERRPDRAIA